MVRSVGDEKKSMVLCRMAVEAVEMFLREMSTLFSQSPGFSVSPMLGHVKVIM